MKKKKKRLIDALKNNRKLQITGACVILVCVVVTTILNRSSITGDVTYKETTVQYGNLTVGVTESGTIDVGTVEQTFDLDMSALQRVTTTNSNSNSNTSNSNFGGMGNLGGAGANGGSQSKSQATDMFSQLLDMGNQTSSSSDSSSNLTVESISVTVGQSISEGDVILTLEKEGVDELKSELESNVGKASADLEALIADQKLSTITAEYTLQTSENYGTYALNEKNATIASLKQDIEDANAALEAAEASLVRYTEQLNTAKTDYENAVICMDNAVWARDHSDKDNGLYWYTLNFNDAETATSTVKSLETKIDELEEKIEQANSNITKCNTNIAKAKRAYAQGVLEAEETYELRMLAYNTASETYDVTIGFLEEDLKEQQETYDETLSKWNEFNSYIDCYDVCSKYSGVVTSISVEEGDKLGTGSVVVTLYDANDVTITVSVDESDMTDIKAGGLANISLTAYPDEIFMAEITEIGDATTDKSGNTTFDVTVTVKGDVSRLFQGMTGEVTFITKQVSQVLYVSNRAIIREDGVSYVKIKRANGNIDKIKVVTGFSDGVNVEITEGLSEGDIVVIEKGES